TVRSPYVLGVHARLRRVVYEKCLFFCVFQFRLVGKSSGWSLPAICFHRCSEKSPCSTVVYRCISCTHVSSHSFAVSIPSSAQLYNPVWTLNSVEEAGWQL
ncbi:unnamed protein product, partial [Ectocarpus sp. 12 AP-2014]